MSMIARFAAITPDDLAAVRQQPDTVGTVIALAADQALESLAHSRERLRFQAPRLIAGMLKRMPPNLQRRLRRRLQVGEDGRLGPGGDKALYLQFAARELARQQAPAAHGAPGNSISLDKAWHGLHYLLCGMLGPTPDPLGQAVCGGEELGGDHGYGPARCFTPPQVAEIARALKAKDLETVLATRFDTADMTQMHVYPGTWEDDDRDWLIEAFRKLRAFYKDAGAANRAVVTVIE